MSLVNVSLVVSDLFFMVDNRAYWETLENNEDEALSVLYETAENFCDLLEHLNENYTAEEIVNDYLDRV